MFWKALSKTSPTILQDLWCTMKVSPLSIPDMSLKYYNYWLKVIHSIVHLILFST